MIRVLWNVKPIYAVAHVLWLIVRTLIQTVIAAFVLYNVLYLIMGRAAQDADYGAFVPHSWQGALFYALVSGLIGYLIGRKVVRR